MILKNKCNLLAKIRTLKFCRLIYYQGLCTRNNSDTSAFLSAFPCNINNCVRHNHSIIEKDRLKKGPPWKLVFFGNDGFALQSLKTLHNLLKSGLVEYLSVVTGKQSHPNTPVKHYCSQHQITFQPWPVSTSSLIDYDLGVVVSFGHLIPEDIITVFPLGMINVHGSLLPRWRGASPVMHAILNNDQHTGITVIRIAPHRFDIGAMVYKKQIEVPWDIKTTDLTKKLAVVGAECLHYTLSDLCTLLPLAQPQPTDAVTKAPILKERACNINWSKKTCLEIQCLYRALDEIYSLYSHWHGEKIFFKEMILVEPFGDLKTNNENIELSERKFLDIEKQLKYNIENTPGMAVFCKDYKSIKIRCKDGWVAFKMFKVKGRKVMTALDFYNGFMTKTEKCNRLFKV